jgi:hypothetical protein
MIYIERELERIKELLSTPQFAEHYTQFYAAQQALAWALDPPAFAAPSDTIIDGKVQPLMDTQANLTDCSGEARHSAS